MPRPFKLAVAVVLAVAPMATAQTVGNLIVMVNEFTGSTSAPKYIAEYTPGGAYVQRLSTLPLGSGENFGRDLVRGPDGATYLYNGTFSPTLERRAGGTWTNQTFPGWSTVNNLTYGGLTADDRYVYATDMATGGGTPQGIVRFDTQGGPTLRFATAHGPIDVNMGLDGFLYSWDGSNVRKYDRGTLAQVGAATSLPYTTNGYRAVAVAADGSIYAATFGDVVRKVSPTGSIIASLSVPGVYAFSDIDINPVTGQVALASADSSLIAVADADLTSYVSQQVSASGSGYTFVAWAVAPVPEPSSLALLAGAAALAAQRRTAARRA